MARKEDSPNMKELLNLITRELDVPKPAGSLPLSLIQRLLSLGGSRISGIPAQSLAFVTDRTFPVHETEALLARMGRSWPDIQERLPFITADLDYRLLPKPEAERSPTDYIRVRKGNLAMLGWEGEGEPWVIVHEISRSVLTICSRLEHRRGGLQEIPSGLSIWQGLAVHLFTLNMTHLSVRLMLLRKFWPQSVVRLDSLDIP